MRSNEFEQAFSDFIDGKEYDAASDKLFHLARAAYEAGWNAALAHSADTSGNADR